MTLEEVRILVNEAKNINWFNAREIRFYNSKSQVDITIKGFSAIYEYSIQQSEGWESKGDNLPQVFNQNKGKIQTLKVQLQSFLNNYKSTEDANFLNSQWQNQVINSFTGEYIPYQLSAVDFLIGLNEKYPTSFNSAKSFLLGGNTEFQNQFANQNNFIGTLMAYEFLTKDSSEILSRKNPEAQALGNTKKDFEKYLSGAEQQINDLLKEAKDKKKTDVDIFTQMFAEEKGRYEKWQSVSKAQFEVFTNESNAKINDLEKTYQGLLKLKEPASYWKERADTLKSEGDVARNWLVVLVGIGVALLYCLLWLTPEGLLKSLFNEDKSIALRWSIIFITFISLIFLGIRYISKLMFSSYHLSRDAEERYRLTYVYLALSKDAKVDDKERHLIMQSLFSRADTGLLKEDSAPTMPSGIEKLIR
jgi:hypothetical protein